MYSNAHNMSANLRLIIYIQRHKDSQDTYIHTQGMEGPRGHRGAPGHGRRNRHHSGDDSMASIRAKASLHALVQKASRLAARNADSATETQTQDQNQQTEVDSGSGAGQLGQCFERDAECEKLGVADNLCGKCKDLGGGAFELYNPGGLRFMGRCVHIYAHVPMMSMNIVGVDCRLWEGACTCVLVCVCVWICVHDM